MSIERKHHPYSPSKLQSLEACPGFKSRDSTNEASQTGTMLHDAVEEYLRSGKVDLKLTDEQAEVVKNCAEFVQSSLAELGPGAKLIVEEYLPIDAEETTAGYLDVGMISANGKRAKIRDWKMGLNPVEDVANNLQGASYMLGLEYKFPGIEECDVAFVMPFQGYGGIVDQHTFHRHEFQGFYLRIKVVVARAKKVTALFESGEITKDWSDLAPSNGTCVFCDRIADCPAVNRLALQAGKKYDPLVVPDVINPLLISSPLDAAKALKFFDVMAALAKSYRSKATEKAMNEENWVPEGYALTSVSRRAIVNKAAFFETIKSLLTPEQVTECIDFTLGPVEKIVSESAPRGKKKEAVEDLKNLLAMNGATEEGAPIAVLRQKKGAENS